MRNILFFLLFILFLAGCSSKKEVVIEQKAQNEVKVVDLEKQRLLKEQRDKLNDQIVNEDDEISFIDNGTNLLTEDELVLNKEKKMDIAIIFPSKLIGKYAKSSINTITGYFLYKKLNFNLKVFDSELESPEKIALTFEKLKESGFKKVIALYTVNGIETINALEGLDELDIYFPLIHKEELIEPNENFIYGGISYEDQMIKLMEYSNYENYMFYQNSYVGQKLKNYFEDLTLEGSISQEIKRKNNNFKALIEESEVNDKTVFLNTNIIKTSIILSQINIYNKEPFIMLSTQLNYNPLLISLTQKKDREKFFVANSIGEVDTILSDIIDNLGANVSYNWVDYSTLVGINYLYDLNSSSLIKTKVVNNQVQYEPRVFAATSFGFLEIKDESEN